MTNVWHLLINTIPMLKFNFCTRQKEIVSTAVNHCRHYHMLSQNS